MRSSYFERYIGMDYSGKGLPFEPLGGIRVSVAERGREPREESPPEGGLWSRARVSEWLVETLRQRSRTLVGIDHAFSFPMTYMQRHGLESWNEFLEDLETHWPTRQRRVADLRQGNLRNGNRDELRLTDRWAITAKSVFHWSARGQVAYSTHAGIPWLRMIRDTLREDIRFWPFDGFDLPVNKSVVAEVYPRIFKKRYDCPPELVNDDDRFDAYAVAKWMLDRDSHGLLASYFAPALTEEEREKARLEGWILGLA